MKGSVEQFFNFVLNIGDSSFLTLRVIIRNDSSLYFIGRRRVAESGYFPLSATLLLSNPKRTCHPERSEGSPSHITEKSYLYYLWYKNNMHKRSFG